MSFFFKEINKTLLTKIITQFIISYTDTSTANSLDICYIQAWRYCATGKSDEGEKIWGKRCVRKCVRTLRGRLTFSSVEPDSAIISSLSFSMKGIRWPTAFFMTRADLMTCKRTRMSTATSKCETRRGEWVSSPGGVNAMFKRAGSERWFSFWCSGQGKLSQPAS